MQSALAEALRERGVDEADLSAALIAAAYRMVHVGAIRRILGGEAPDVVMVDRSDALARAFAAVESAIAGLGRR